MLHSYDLAKHWTPAATMIYTYFQCGSVPLQVQRHVGVDRVLVLQLAKTRRHWNVLPGRAKKGRQPNVML